MSFLLAWVAFPLLAAVATLGWGLLAELATGRPLPGALLAPLGLAAIIVVSQVLTASGATAELATPAVALGAVVGLVVSRPRWRRVRPDRWQLGAAVAVVAIYAAPFVLSGSATFAGYGQLGDIADQFVVVDSMMHVGNSVGAPSTVAGDPTTSAYDMAVAAYPGQSYPTGMHTALGRCAPLVGQDVAWVYQPYLAVVMALAALALLPLLEPVLASRRGRAFAVTVAAVPALTYAYGLQGSIKELGTVWAIALLAGLLPWYAAAAPGPRRPLPLVLAAAAGLAVVGVAIGAWLGPLLVVYLFVAARRGGRSRARAAALEAVAFAAPVAILALPTLTQLDLYREVSVGVVTRGSELGNLIHPLSKWQVLPAWPTWDFRLAPVGVAEWLAVGAAGALVALGVATILRRAGRHWALVVWLGVNLVAWVYLTHRGSPWADAKLLAISAPAAALAGAVAAAAMIERGLRLEGAMLATLLGAAVVVSLAQEVRGASLAPRDRLSELARLGPKLQGPTLYPAFEPYAKYFLRHGAPDSLTEPFPGYSAGPLRRDGVSSRPLGSSYDLDDLSPEYVSHFRTIVLRRGPASRPPATYRRVWRGRWYEAWERSLDPRRRLIGVVAAGGPASAAGAVPVAAGRPACGAVRSLARLARRRGARLVAYPRPRPVVWTPATAFRLPAGWGVDGSDATTLGAARPGAVRGTVDVASAGDYTVWIASSLGADVTVSVDGRDVGRLSGAIQPRAQFLSLGDLRLAPGRHAIAVRRGAPGLRPGAEGGSRLIGQVVLEPAHAADGRLLTVAPARADELCRMNVDWVQAVSG